MSALTSLLEYVSGTTPCRVDRDKGIVYGVKYLGEQSANGPPNDNTYPRATREQAISLLEGARIYLNHPEKGKGNEPRRYEDGIGTARNLRESGTGLVGDFHFNPKHHLAEQIAWDAEHAPEHFGFSINALGKTKRHAGRNLVEQIVKVHSVDLVSRGATTRSLFEGLNVQTMTLKQLLERLQANGSEPARGQVRSWPEAVQGLREIAAAAGMPEDATMPEPASTSPDDAIKAGFKAAIHAVVDDDGMDMAAKVGKIKEILKAQEKLMGGGKTADAPDKVPESAVESHKGTTVDPAMKALQEQLQTMQRKDKAREICDGLSLKPSAVLLEAMVALGDEGKMKALAESQVKSSGQHVTGSNGTAGRPKSSAPGTTGIQETYKPPADSKAFARQLKS